MNKYTYTVNNSKAITDNYTVKKEKISGITVYMYIPKEKKENKMTKTNLEKYKYELGKIFYQGCGNPAAMFDKIKTKCDSNIRSNYGQTYIEDILDWMSQPYKEPILNDVEKDYLSAIIKPFRKKVNYISKIEKGSSTEEQFIKIVVNFDEYVNLPYFNKSSRMYMGMEPFRKYTLEELGL